MKTVLSQIEDGELEKLRKACYLENLSMSKLIRKIIVKYLDEKSHDLAR